MQIKLPDSVKNWLSIAGVTLSLISLLLILFFWLLMQAQPGSGAYLGLIGYIIIPAFFVLGLLLIPIGMIRTLQKDNTESARWPFIDLNINTHRTAFFIFITGTLIFIFLTTVGSYEAFHYTESVEFCGTLCHTVMEPEYTAYQYSAHARVACVECHVGNGANWYVRSKLSGLYQIYAVLANRYPTPIPTPIENLRPARETCEQCHWPQKFYTYNQRKEVHFLPDEKNTRWDIHLTLKIGASHSSEGLSEGIHWHINPDIRIEYIALDSMRQELPWVRFTNLKTGITKTFRDRFNQPASNLPATVPKRTMDCIDCHNRPSHNYLDPSTFVNNQLIANAIPKNLPEIKSLALELCEPEYETQDSALYAIADGIKTYYRNNYPELFEKKQLLIQKAIQGLQTIYKQNIFPEMNVRWNVHPNNIGHMNSKGCFRCHNSNLVNENQETISHQCTLCHLINAQGTTDKMEVASFGKSLNFKHPVDIEEEWKESLCSECHTGLNP